MPKAKEMYLHAKNRSVAFQKHRKMLCFHHVRVFTRCCLQNVLARVLFSKSTVFKICRQKMCRFRVNGRGGLSITFFTVFKMSRHRVNTVLDSTLEEHPEIHLRKMKTKAASCKNNIRAIRYNIIPGGGVT